MQKNQDIIHWAWVSSIARSHARAIMDYFDTHTDTAWQIEALLPDLPPVCPLFCKRLETWLEASSLHHFVPVWSKAYPPLLRHIPMPPLGLYVMGNVAVLSTPQIATVGTRKPTPLGAALATEFAKGLGQAGLTITSGLALGIDGYAHRGALAVCTPTIGVMATGIDCIYPLRHQSLALDMIQQGAIVTEFPLGSKPLAPCFPQRNRIISGLSKGVLVVEAAIRSGTLTTARHAVEQNRDVFAIPGSIKNDQTQGCHLLIKQGAKLVETLDDILIELSVIAQNDQNNTGQNQINCTHLDREDRQMLAILETETVGVDELISRLALPAQEVACRLVELELRGLVLTTPSGYTRAWGRNMKENVLDVLIYLFDNVFDTESEVETDQETLADELEAAGFEKIEIDKAFNWLEGLHFAQAQTESVRAKTKGGIRIYAAEELDRICAQCRGFLLTMEECGVIDAQLREMVIERVMALESVEVDLTQLKWVILMVLCNSNREDGPSVEWVEEVMLGDFTETMH